MTKKYKQGKVIENLNELGEQTFIIVDGKTYHKGWWQSWQLRMLLYLLKDKRIYAAERSKNENNLKNTKTKI